MHSRMLVTECVPVMGFSVLKYWKILRLDHWMSASSSTCSMINAHRTGSARWIAHQGMPQLRSTCKLMSPLLQPPV